MARAVGHGNNSSSNTSQSYTAAPSSSQYTSSQYTSSAASAPPPPADDCDDVGVEHAECPICYDEMHKFTSAVFVAASGKRTCSHFFHETCAREVGGGGARTCPVCRAPYASVLPIPDMRLDPKGWFRIMDLDGDGKLSLKEVAAVLKAQIPMDWKKLETRSAEDWFKKWDRDGDGGITFQEMMHPATGILAFVRQMFPRQTAADAQPPDIQRHRLAWFDHFDEDRSGTLEKQEVVRAIVKTFGLSQDASKVKSV